MIRFALTLLLTLAVAVTLACGDADKPANVVVVNSVNKTGPAQPPLASPTIDELASGEKVYVNNCMACHKEDGTGGEVVIEGKKINPDDLSSAKIKGFSDEKIIGYIMNGIEEDGMPAFKDKLSEGEMRDVVKYIRTQIQKMPIKAGPTPKTDQLAN